MMLPGQHRAPAWSQALYRVLCVQGLSILTSAWVCSRSGPIFKVEAPEVESLSNPTELPQRGRGMAQIQTQVDSQSKRAPLPFVFRRKV